jgi:hypothetical protein
MPKLDPRLVADEMERFPAILRALLPLDDVELLRSREREGRWSPLEILVHLRDEEVEDFRARVRSTSEGKLPEKGIDPQGWVAARRYNEQDPAEILKNFERERAASVAWLRTLDPSAMEASVEHPKLGTFRAGDFLAAWRMHDLLHLRQLATALAVLHARRLAGWRVEYAGDVPTP